MFGTTSEVSPLIVCLHDTAVSHEVWNLFAMDFGLSGYAVLTYDLYGEPPFVILVHDYIIPNISYSLDAPQVGDFPTVSVHMIWNC